MLRVLMGLFLLLGVWCSPMTSETVEATVVPVNMNSGAHYKVDIDDSSVYMIGPGHANVIITPYYARWNPSYPVEVYWGKGYAVYRLDKDGNRNGTEISDFALAIANYMSEHY